jgi:hypothetical protein
LIWSENEDLSSLELVVYYIEHLFTSFLGPLILSISGRYDPLFFAKFPLPVAGFHIFSLYMRFVLTPIALYTWVNLNHSLCGVDNDPFYAIFDLGKWYYIWADVYLLMGCYAATVVNYLICFIFKKLFCPNEKAKGKTA